MIVAQEGSVWLEKSRPGHTVEIVKYDAHSDEYTIKHLTAHNVRKQRSLTTIKTKNFHQRYEPVKLEVKPELPGQAPDAATVQAKEELAACLELRVYWRSKAIEARAERDAALAAIERARAVTSEKVQKWYGVDMVPVHHVLAAIAGKKKNDE